MVLYASGRKARAVCDRCGQEYKLRVLRKEWTGYRVCPQCFEERHPQLQIRRNLKDPQALRDPRPELDVQDELGTGSWASTASTNFGATG